MAVKGLTFALNPDQKTRTNLLIVLVASVKIASSVTAFKTKLRTRYYVGSERVF